MFKVGTEDRQMWPGSTQHNMEGMVRVGMVSRPSRRSRISSASRVCGEDRMAKGRYRRIASSQVVSKSGALRVQVEVEVESMMSAYA